VAKVDASSACEISQYATISTINDATLTTMFATYTVTPSSTYTFALNAFYVVGFHDTGGSAAIWGNTLDANVLARPSVVNSIYYYNTSGGVQANALGPYEMSVSVAGVPEPATWTLMSVGFGGLGAALQSARCCSRVAVA
jgi:hypothetical protein